MEDRETKRVINNHVGSLQDHQDANFEFGIINSILQSPSIDCQTERK